ncbi:hypothetical protein [uncultured Desulfovibrio sp.]|nr:hypothetical protein [uncultured Desulfovibrio sp.]
MAFNCPMLFFAIMSAWLPVGKYSLRQGTAKSGHAMIPTFSYLWQGAAC